MGQAPFCVKNRWVLVTGATSGLGEALALLLAKEGANIVLVGRRDAKLARLKASLDTSGVQTKAICADLASEAGCHAVLDGLTDMALSAAILNAGVTHLGALETADNAAYQAMIDLNVASAVTLSHALLPQLKAEQGALMLVASMGGLTPLPYQSVYAGTKAFLVNFGLSLAAEAQTAPASVTVFAPGGIATEMTDGPEFVGQRQYLMAPEGVANDALNGLCHRKTLVIPGRQNNLMASALKVLPRRWATALTERSFRQSIATSKPKE